MIQSSSNSKFPFDQLFIKNSLDLLQYFKSSPILIKIGQFLALRPDLVSPEYCNRLMNLFDGLPPFSWEEAETILHEELGDPITIFDFDNFPPKPFATTAFSQVYKATLKGGDSSVAIKVQQPYLLELIKRDFDSSIQVLEEIFSEDGILPKSSFDEIITELRAWIFQEIDFENEIKNLARLSQLVSDEFRTKIPQFYPELCKKRVLVIEYLYGTSFNDVFKGIIPESLPLNNVIPKIDQEQLAQNLVESSLNQIFRYKFFHADLHIENLIALTENSIGFVDFGFCEELDERIRKQQIQCFVAIYNGNIEKMLDSLSEILVTADKANIDAFREELSTKTKAWMSAKRKNDQSLNTIASFPGSPIAQWLIELMQTARKYEIKIPLQILSMYRTLVALETASFRLAPEADLGKVWGQFFQSLQIEEALLELLTPQTIQALLYNSLVLLRDAPLQINQILSKMSDNTFAVNVYSSDTPKVILNRNRQTRLLSTSILSVGISLLLTIPDQPLVFGFSLVPLWWSLLVSLYIYIFFIWQKLS